MSDAPETAKPKKKGGLVKLLVPVIGGLGLIGAGAGGGAGSAQPASAENETNAAPARSERDRGRRGTHESPTGIDTCRCIYLAFA